MDYPHRLVGGVIDGVAEAVKGVVSSVVGGIQGTGEQVMRATDAPLKATLGIEGPLRIIDGVADGATNAARTFVNQGIIEPIQQFGEGVSVALDHPLRQVGGGAGSLPPLPFDMPGRW